MNRPAKLLRPLLYRGATAAARLLPAAGKAHYRLAILKLDRLGDAALALGAFRRLLLEFGEHETLLIVSDFAEPLLRAEFPKANFLVLPAFCHRYWPDFLTFLWHHGSTLRTLAVENLVSLRHQPSDYLHAIARLIRPTRCFATHWPDPWNSVDWSFPHAVVSPYPLLGQSTACAELEAHRRIVALALDREVSPGDVLPAIASVPTLDGAPVLVCPSAGSALREYPPSMLADALRIFQGSRSTPIHFCLPPGADPAPWQTALHAAGVACVTWHQPATLVELLHLLANAGLVLAPESAPAHLATAMDKHAVFLLGGGHHGLFAPWAKSSRQIWLDHAIECYHCRWNCVQPEPYCITHIAPKSVADAMHQSLLVG